MGTPRPTRQQIRREESLSRPEKNLSEHSDKVDADTKAEIEKALEEAKALDSTSGLEVIKEKSAALSAASMKIGEAMYKKGGDGEASAEGEAPKDDKDATEAEYTEKKKEEGKQ